MTNRGWPILVVLIALAAVLSAAAAESDDDGRFLAGLRQRRLFELAENYCRRELDRPDLTPLRQASLVVELSATLADQAVYTAPAQREPLWQQAWQVTEQFAAAHPQHPRRVLVRVQGAIALVTRGELARQEAEVVSPAEPLRQEALTHLRRAIRLLEELADEAREQLRQSSPPGRGTPAQGELSPHQWSTLGEKIQYQLARALRNQALCYPAESPDRANSLTQAVKLLDVLARLDPDRPLAYPSRVDQIACYRLLQDFDTARQKLAALLAQKPSAAILLRARAEEIRLALATGQLSAAVALLSEGGQIGGVSSGELDYAWLEASLAAWQAAVKSGDAQVAAGWQKAATRQVERIERRSGPYWGRRAQMLLARYVDLAPAGASLPMQVHAAENAYRSGHPEQALAAYDRARAMAAEEGQPEQAFALGLAAATIEHDRHHDAEALERYRQLALAMPQDPRAAAAHQLAIYHAGRLALADPDGHLAGYAELLGEHLRHWPTADTANQVRWQLGRLRQHQQEWAEALAAYGAITSDFADYGKVVEALVRCYRARLAALQATGRPTESTAAEAARWFESLVFDADGRPPEQWSPVAREAVLAAAEFWSHDTKTGFDRAERILSIALAGNGHASPRWTSAAEVLSVYALAGQGRLGEAARLLERVSQGPTSQLLTVLEGLAAITAEKQSNVRAELAELQLRTIDLLKPRRDQLSPHEQRTLDRLAAGALEDAGRRSQALAAYRRLAEAYPQDGAIQEAYGRVLLESEDRAGLEAALAQWRQIEKHSHPGTERYFRAKYSVAWLHHRLGNPRQAEKIIRLLEALQPEMGGPAMKAKFEQLSRQCQPQ